MPCYPSPEVGNGKHRPLPSPLLPPQGGAKKQLSEPNSLFAGSVSTHCARGDRLEARASCAVPEVRIHLPPAEGHANFISHKSLATSDSALSPRAPPLTR